MSRFLFFLLLLAALALGAHLFLAVQTEKSDFRARERNADSVRIVAVTPPAVAAQRAEEGRRTLQSLVGAACVEFSNVPVAEAARARNAFSALGLGSRLTERPVEEITRHWVFVRAADRRGAEAAVAQLRRQGLTDVSLRPDNTVSLGVFSSEEAARRFLASVEAKGVRNAEQGPFARELRELVFLIREPDSELVARLTLLQRDFPGAQLRAVACPTQ